MIWPSRSYFQQSLLYNFWFFFIIAWNPDFFFSIEKYTLKLFGIKYINVFGIQSQTISNISLEYLYISEERPVHNTILFCTSYLKDMASVIDGRFYEIRYVQTFINFTITLSLLPTVLNLLFLTFFFALKIFDPILRIPISRLAEWAFSHDLGVPALLLIILTMFISIIRALFCESLQSKHKKVRGGEDRLSQYPPKKTASCYSAAWGWAAAASALGWKMQKILRTLPTLSHW